MKINWFNLTVYTAILAICAGFWYTFIITILHFMNK
jgi:hypothetical protein